jgi:hypothetical protein
MICIAHHFFLFRTYLHTIQNCHLGLDPKFDTVTTVTLTKNKDSFLGTFSALYKSNKQTKGSLAVALMWCLCVKARGHRNAQFPAILMNFFITLGATPQKSIDFLSTSFLVPGLWCMQHNNVKTRVPPFIICEEETVMSRLDKHIKSIPDNSDVVAFSLCFDGTKVPTALGLLTAHKAIVGRSAPNQFIRIEGKSEDWVLSLLAP